MYSGLVRATCVFLRISSTSASISLVSERCAEKQNSLYVIFVELGLGFSYHSDDSSQCGRVCQLRSNL